MEIIVRIIKINPWQNVTKWAGCHDYIAPYFTRSGNIYTGLTPEEARRFEKALGYPEGHLSPVSPYWTTFAIKIGRDDLKLNTDNPADEMKYIFLKNHKRVANGVDQITPATDYVLINQDVEAEVANKRSRVKKDALLATTKMTLEEMRKALRVFGMRPDTMSNELVEAKLNEIVEREPEKFMSRWVNNKDKEITFVIEEAISKNIIRKNRAQYYFGTDLIGNGLDDVIAYLQDKKNQDIKLAIMSEIQSKGV